MRFDNVNIKEIGNTLEDYIAMRNVGYKNKGIADIRKAHEHVVITRFMYGKIQEGFIKGKSDLDWYGMTRDHGFIKFDTKACKTNKLSLNSITEGQIKILSDSLEYDMKAFILAWNYTDDNFYIVPAKDVLEAWERYLKAKGFKKRAPKGTAYIDLEKYKPFKHRNSLDYIENIDF